MSSHLDFTVGSYNKTFSFNEEEENENGVLTTADIKPRILLMGLQWSGKSSIQKVVSQNHNF